MMLPKASHDSVQLLLDKSKVDEAVRMRRLGVGEVRLQIDVRYATWFGIGAYHERPDDEID